MTFFEDFKRSASDVADKAVKKTGELTNIAKLNVTIKTKEAKLSAVYEEIGRLFYNAERSGEDYTGEIADHIMKADKIKADIASCKQEIMKLRKAVVCEGCGNEIAEDAAFCSYCGMKQVKPEEPACGCDEEETCGCGCEEAEKEPECTCEEETCTCGEEEPCTCEDSSCACDCPETEEKQ